MNGFTAETVGASIIIADGLVGRDQENIEINGYYFKEIYIGSAIYYSDFIIATSYITAHDIVGYGGAIKNLAMGMLLLKESISNTQNFYQKLIKNFVICV